MAMDTLKASSPSIGNRFHVFYKPVQTSTHANDRLWLLHNGNMMLTDCVDNEERADLDHKPGHAERRAAKARQEGQVAPSVAIKEKANEPFHQVVSMLNPSASGTMDSHSKKSAHRTKLVGLNRPLSSKEVNSSISKTPMKQMGQLNLTTRPDLPKALVILSPTSTTGSYGSTNSVVTELGPASRERRPSNPMLDSPASKSIAGPPGKAMTVEGIDALEGRLSVDLQIPVALNPPSQYEVVKYGTERIAEVYRRSKKQQPTSTRISADASHARKKLKTGPAKEISGGNGALTIELRCTEGVAARTRDYSEAQRVQHTTKNGNGKGDVDVLDAACSLLALDPERERRWRLSLSLTNGATPTSTKVVSGQKVDEDGRKSADFGRTKTADGEFVARATSVLPRPVSKQRYRSIAAILAESC